ncbi:fibrobacter succinogenes major paralogous domain-containing protein [Hallerella succinigenes]|uniref:Uncharacterized protein (TIGR02145 family) n=1 Tax=Hallerella succinigenes TaxID=1896222 RepID=A0A2M9A374_9BACT|nr:fibrobacter succinogenes major paralogous domain-containing protein [Hallerella succinigenes]PJJ40176.1 uncharacterized protein (TIGR02145 family) [Hallerella succinigenes]
MKKFLVTMGLVAFAFVGCDDSSSASVGPNDEPGIESSSSSSGKVTEPAEVTSSSSEKAKQSNSSSSVDTISSSSLQGDKNFSSSSVASSSNSAGNVITYGTMTDSRDGQIYKTVTIGTQTWMAENLNYAYTGVPYNYRGYTSDSTSWCYEDAPANCTKYGRLYTWAAAMDSVGEWSTNGRGCGYGSTCSPTLPVRGVCPKGWHLPRRSEWEALFTTVGGSSTAGKKLKSLTGWYNSSNGTDAYSFAALPAGLRDGYGHYEDEGYYAFFWSSTERNGYFAYSMALYYVNDNAFLYTYDYDNSNGFSVRCVED